LSEYKTKNAKAVEQIKQQLQEQINNANALATKNLDNAQAQAKQEAESQQ